MPAQSAAIIIPAVLFGATVIRSAFGFGEALIAVPLLALVVPVEVALIAVVSGLAEDSLAQRGLPVLPTLLGIPLGLVLLKSVSEPVVKAVLATVI